MRPAFRVLLVAALSALPVPGLAEAFRLIMVEQPGCYHCARWHDQIGPTYPLSAEGRLAPLEQVALRGNWPDGVVIGARPVFTPTFLLLKDNVEVARIEGYPGENIFWGTLNTALRDAGAALAQKN